MEIVTAEDGELAKDEPCCPILPARSCRSLKRKFALMNLVGRRGNSCAFLSIGGGSILVPTLSNGAVRGYERMLWWPHICSISVELKLVQVVGGTVRVTRYSLVGLYSTLVEFLSSNKPANVYPFLLHFVRFRYVPESSITRTAGTVVPLLYQFQWRASSTCDLTRISSILASFWFPKRLDINRNDVWYQ